MRTAHLVGDATLAQANDQLNCLQQEGTDWAHWLADALKTVRALKGKAARLEERVRRAESRPPLAEAAETTTEVETLKVRVQQLEASGSVHLAVVSAGVSGFAVMAITSMVGPMMQMASGLIDPELETLREAVTTRRQEPHRICPPSSRECDLDVRRRTDPSTMLFPHLEGVVKHKHILAEGNQAVSLTHLIGLGPPLYSPSMYTVSSALQNWVCCNAASNRGRHQYLPAI